MAEAYVYDAVRTPRGRGKKDGSLHEVPAVRLGAKVLEALRDRNGLDTGDGRRHHLRLRRSGRRGRLGHSARRRLRGGLRHQGARHADLALLRVRPRRHQFRRGQDRAGRGRHRDRRRRGIDEPRRHGHVGRRLVHGPVGRPAGLVRAAGYFRRPDRHQIRLQQRRRRRLCGGEPEARRQGVGRGPLQELGHSGQGPERPDDPRSRRAHAARRPTCRRSASSTRPL